MSIEHVFKAERFIRVCNIHNFALFTCKYECTLGWQLITGSTYMCSLRLTANFFTPSATNVQTLRTSHGIKPNHSQKIVHPSTVHGTDNTLRLDSHDLYTS